MIILITGASHTGKTAFAQRLLEKYKFPYLSLDHLKMGLIRSGNTDLTPLSDDEKLTEYLWPIACEIIKTAVENKQNLIVEGCYIPFDYEKYFSEDYLSELRFVCLVMSEKYINNHFSDIIKYENICEQRMFSNFTPEEAFRENNYYFSKAKEYDVNYVLIEDIYEIDDTCFKLD